MPLQKRLREGAPRKAPVIALVQRDGDVRTFPIQSANAASLKGAILENVDKSAKIMTDKWHAYTGIGKEFAGGHHTVNHSVFQYVRPGNIHTNTVESYFSLLKRGIVGTFHHVSRAHLVQYCGEFAFRWNYKRATDTDRTVAALKTVSGKRLFYGNLQTQGAY
jgi:ISXO2-like transposase domain